MRAATQWPIWSTTARLVMDRPAAIDRARDLAIELLGRIDDAASRFRPDSEIVRLAPRMPDGVEVSELLADLVRHGLDAAAVSGGLVDPTLGNDMVRAGYAHDIRFVMDDDRPARAILSRRPGWSRVHLRGRVLTVPDDLALDLGATAKAVAADRIAAEIAERFDCAVLLSLGGDIATAGPEPDGGWSVRADDGPGQPASSVRLTAGFALATSSTLHRRWKRAGSPMHHILDPSTGLPASPVWRTVSVVARSCFLANTFATAAVVRGDDAPSWVAQRAGARLVAADGGVHAVGGWPAELAAIDASRAREAVPYG